MKTSLEVLEQKIKEAMAWHEKQDSYDTRYSTLSEVLEMIVEVRKG